jgi:nicotinate-nucleotide adenylyltransferase
VARIGILGGTFNPPHLGHLALARHARDGLDLESVLLMPARIPPHKPGGEDPGAEHRLRMCRLAVDREPGLSVSVLEIERDGPSYTADTLRAVHASHPQLELTFIVGADVARTLPSWREPAGVLELAGLAVAARAGSDREAVLEALAPLTGPDHDVAGTGGATGVRFLEMPAIDISSSMVRERVAMGESAASLVGEAVARYIAEHGLYRSIAQARG